jgi:hypothetical protein
MTTPKRSRSPQVNTIIAAAAKAGLRVSGATIVDGRVELKFEPSDAAPSSAISADEPSVLR